MHLRLDRWGSPGNSSWRQGRGVGVAVGLVAVLVLGYAVVAVVADVPGEGRWWPGQGVVALAAVVIVGLASLAASLRQSRSGTG